jgi:hypothetical protein
MASESVYKTQHLEILWCKEKEQLKQPELPAHRINIDEV